MPDSHLPAQHFLKQLEAAASKPKTRPVWLTDLIDSVADLFEPFAELGRVGFECTPQRERWNVNLYLGANELVGGSRDGALQEIDFQFDVLRLFKLLDEVNRLEWNAFPRGGSSDKSPECTYLSADALFRGNPVRIRVFGTPPSGNGPGMKKHLDGRLELV